MAEEKRNHPRAKVLSMTVRYKSATVDDFIEHHSDNVSRGGIFIKTTSPFPPGTLLKFEIRIADDEAVLAGVGRVVWKKDEAGEGEPPGMGVKFIKLDEKSRALLSRLVESQDGAESKYDKGFAQEQATKEPLKETLLGLGSLGAEEGIASGKTGTDDGPEPTGGMFPKSSPSDDMPPPEERTVMKQAAELLEQALESAGGSIDELGAGLGETITDDGWGADDDPKEDDDGWGAGDAKKDDDAKHVTDQIDTIFSLEKKGAVRALSNWHTHGREIMAHPLGVLDRRRLKYYDDLINVARKADMATHDWSIRHFAAI